MAAIKGYTNTLKVASYLGRDLTADQNLQVEVLIPAVEAWIDQRARRAWLTGTVTDEAHYWPDTNIYLLKTPIASVTTVTARVSLSDVGTALVAGVSYEVRDLTTGWIYLPSGYGTLPGPAAGGLGAGAYDRVLVTYIPNTGLPDDISLAATMLVANYLRPVVEGVQPGIKSYSVGQELSVTYADGTEAGIPDEAARLVDGRRRWSFV